MNTIKQPYQQPKMKCHREFNDMSLIHYMAFSSKYGAFDELSDIAMKFHRLIQATLWATQI